MDSKIIILAVVLVCCCLCCCVCITGGGGLTAWLVSQSSSDSDSPTSTSNTDSPTSTSNTNPFVAGTQTNTATDVDDGNVVYLDRHNVQCGSNAINQFQLQSLDGNHIQYKYTCASGGSLKAPVSNSTQWSDSFGYGPDARYAIVYDSKIAVDCGASNVLTQFKASYQGDLNAATEQMKYTYACAPSNKTLSCRTVTNNDSDIGDGIHYLDRQNVKCNSDEVLSAFNISKNGTSQHYVYKCCK